MIWRRMYTGFSVGDLVACGGVGVASHAEVVCVPANLCVKLEQNADLKQAAYNTLGAIALQGVRQADLRLGETCAVIGLGLLGQLTGLLLRASGVRVVGIDIDPAMVNIGAQTLSGSCAEYERITELRTAFSILLRVSVAMRLLLRLHRIPLIQ